VKDGLCLELIEADGGRQPSTLELARFAAAMQELKDAREAFAPLIAGDTER
jgi:hypothetical protein